MSRDEAEEEEGKLRIDKWLWAARFFKTRALAAEAVQGGKVHLNGTRVKASRGLHPGDELRIVRGEEELVVTVRRLSPRRGPATEAAGLYEEGADSRARREAAAERRRLERAAAPPPEGRPSKRDRRQIIRFRRENQ